MDTVEETTEETNAEREARLAADLDAHYGGSAVSYPAAVRKTDNEYLHRIHFWIRLWSVMTIVGVVMGAIFVIGIMRKAYAEEACIDKHTLSYCLEYGD